MAVRAPLGKARHIVVQIELWDPHDYDRPVGELGGWSPQPFNPAHTVHFTFTESGLIETVDWSAGDDLDKDHPFFQTAPAERDHEDLRRRRGRLDGRAKSASGKKNSRNHTECSERASHEDVENDRLLSSRASIVHY